MKCPFCSFNDTQVKDSRVSEDGSYIRRRRICSECGSRFTTFERIQLREIEVIKKDGRAVPFEREKLLRSITLSCQKRPITDEQIDKIVNGIQRNLETSGETTISSEYIGQLVLDALEILDPIAFIRFSSVYKDFQSKDDFIKLIDKLPEEINPTRKKTKSELF
ncbi:MAG: transcriptional regulator NrdR [Rickettsiales bacterium]|nr:transcriptional regulator NrdR [Rickettsiales bacterium]